MNTVIDLPNDIFSNNRKTKDGDIGDGILDIFDRYNFTVKEDEPLEKEVAIDPEMLGKVFENLLEIRDRKSKGTYYTPREIVHYMCEQSLANYLISAISSPSVIPAKAGIQCPAPTREDINTLIKYGETVAEHEAEVISRDNETKTYSYKLPKSIRDNAKLIDEKLANIKICDQAIGSGAFPVGMMNEIVKTRLALNPYLANSATKQFRTAYNFKRDCIQNSLYGIDIDPGAVEIAKLRLWLSLVVDEEDIKQIKPLPNLDYKIVCGNSLLGVEKNLFNSSLFNKLEELKPLFFNETSGIKKKEYKKRIDDIIAKLTNGRKDFDFEIYFSEVFHKNGGFDVVIGNPPYIDSEAMVNEQKNLREFISGTYAMTKGNWDIYIAFFEFSFKILNVKGILTFITPDKWISKPFGDELRKNMIGNLYSVLKAGRKIFETAKVDSIVSLFKKSCCANLKIFNFENNQIIFKSEINKKILQPPFAFDFLFSDNLRLLLKIENASNKISDLSNCENACATSDAYKLKSFIKNLSKDNFNCDKQLKIINTGTIDKYVSKWGNREMTYLKDKYLCPIVDKQKFLNSFKNSYAKKSVRSKIIIKGLTLLDACLDFKGNIIPGKSTLIIVNKDINKLKFLLAILNSKLIFFYIKEKYPASSYNQGINFTKDMINNFPIPKITPEKQKSLIKLVDQILEKKKDNPEADTGELEREIDRMVYGLYGLGEEEIEIVEKNTKIDI